MLVFFPLWLSFRCNASPNCSTGYVFSRYPFVMVLVVCWWHFACIRVGMYYVNGSRWWEHRVLVRYFFSFLTWHLNESNWRRVFKYHFSLICRCRNSRCPHRHHHLLFVVCNIIRFFLVAALCSLCVRSLQTCLCCYVNTNAHTFACVYMCWKVSNIWGDSE